MPHPFLPTTEPVPPEALGLSLQRLLAHPLSALRASIESLAAGLERGEPAPGRALDGALDEIARLTRDVEALVELAAPRSLAPVPCSMEEIVLSALRGLSPRERARVRSARTEQELALRVDGPLLARCLTYLLQAALDGSPDWVLLRGGHEGEATVFSIVCNGAERSLLPERIDPGQGREHVTRAVRVAAAEHDLARMGARLSLDPTEHGSTCIRVELGGSQPPRANRKESAR
jgi:K+-sensing histidine kinase KdpD